MYSFILRQAKGTNGLFRIILSPFTSTVQYVALLRVMAVRPEHVITIICFSRMGEPIGGKIKNHNFKIILAVLNMRRMNGE